MLALLTAALARRHGFPTAPVSAFLGSPPKAVPAAAADLAGYLIAGGPSPVALLTTAYGQVLRLVPRAGPDYEPVPSRTGCRQAGAYYTPPAVAQEITGHTLAQVPAVCPCVLDPAMGTGTFLLAAVRVLAGSSGSPAVAAERYIFGVDCDRRAVALAILGLWLETGARLDRLRRHLRVADALRVPWLAQSFDAVLGNPPWGANRAATHPELAGVPDRCKPFLVLAATTARHAAGMIVPRAFLSQPGHDDVRAFLGRRLALTQVLPVEPEAFPGAAAPACALILKRRAESPTSSGRLTPGLTPHMALLRRLQERFPLLGDAAMPYRVRDTGINYRRASAARRVLYTGPEPESPLDLPRYRGRDFARYTCIARSGWLRHDFADRVAPGERFSFGRDLPGIREKIVLRQTADRPIATLDRTGMVMGRSVIAITAEDGASLPALLAVLNSRLLTVLYEALAGERGRILPQVKVGRLHALPIPVSEPGWLDLQVPALALFGRQGRDAALDEEIDRLVYRLYGLEAEEVTLTEAD